MKDSTFQKYKLVVDEWFVNGWNGTKAYQKYYPNSSDETGATEFYKILRIPKIAEYVEEKKRLISEDLNITSEKVLQEIKNWAYSDITETLTMDSGDIQQLPAEVRRLITSYKKTETRFGKDNENIKTTVELKFVSKEKAMEMIQKHIGFYEKDNFQKQPKIDVTKLSIEALKEIENASE